MSTHQYDEDEAVASNQLAHLENHYELKNQPEILDFIAENDHLAKLLREVPSRVKKYFAKEKLALELSIDPEEGTKELVIYIQTPLDPKTARSKLRALDAEWWLNASTKVDKKSIIGIHIEYI